MKAKSIPQILVAFVFAGLLSLYAGCADVPSATANAAKQTNVAAVQDADSTWESFKEKADAWRSLTNKPPLPEDVHKYQVLAANAVQEKQFGDAANYYEQGLAIYPLWPDAQHDVAMIDGELGNYGNASFHGRCYLELVPDASDAQTIGDQIIIWDEKAKMPPVDSQSIAGMSDEEKLNYYRRRLGISHDDEWDAIKPAIDAVLFDQTQPHQDTMFQRRKLMQAQRNLKELLNSEQQTTAISLGLLESRR